jgi:hypothetical protein
VCMIFVLLGANSIMIQFHSMRPVRLVVKSLPEIMNEKLLQVGREFACVSYPYAR